MHQNPNTFRHPLGSLAPVNAGDTIAARVFSQRVGSSVSGLTAYQPLDATLTAFAALTIAANSLTIGTGADAFSQVTFAANTFPARGVAGNLVAWPITNPALDLLDDFTHTAMRTTLGVNQSPTDFIHLQDVKAATTAGGAFTSGAWRTRTLNTEVTDTGNHCTLASNQFTLLAGTYRFWARAPAFYVGNHKARLQNITDGTTVIEGGNQYMDATLGVPVHTDAIVFGRFTIGSTKTFELQHRCASTGANGFGFATNFAANEIYAEITLEREAG